MTCRERERGFAFPLRRGFCRLTAPLFRWLFLGPDGKPPFLLAKAPVSLPQGHPWWVPVDERGRLLQNPQISVHDKAFWQQTTNRNMAIYVAMFMVFGLSIPAYIVIIHKVGFHSRESHDFKTFFGIYMTFVLAVSAIVFSWMAGSSRETGRSIRPWPAPCRLRYFALNTVFLIYRRGTRDTLLMLVGTPLMGLFLTWARQVIAAYPPTPFVLAHLWGAMALEALCWTLAALFLLLNTLFWPCLKCHGLQAETFLYRA